LWVFFVNGRNAPRRPVALPGIGTRCGWATCVLRPQSLRQWARSAAKDLAAQPHISDAVRRRHFALVLDLRFVSGELDFVRPLCGPVPLRPPARIGRRSPALRAGRRRRLRAPEGSDLSRATRESR
jgi:hypothetical protein